jgi:hypothetical protein
VSFSWRRTDAEAELVIFSIRLADMPLENEDGFWE